MKTKKMSLVMLSVLCVISFLFTACDNDDVIVVQRRGYKSWFTVKVTDDNSYYFQHDKGKTFLPVAGLQGYAPKKDQRAFAYYEVALEKDSKGYDYPIYVYRMDTILSKNIAENLHDKNEAEYGNDPVRIDAMWVGSGFLTIRFSTYWGGRHAHYVNLIQENEDNPYELTFRHNAYSDPKNYWGYGWVAFNLADLPLTEEGKVELIIKTRTYDGVIEKKFTYNPNNDHAEDPTNEDEEEEIEASSAIKLL